MNLEQHLILIPAYNEEKTIGDVIAGLKMHGFKNILVVNDGSKDSTERVARDLGVHVLSHKINLGVGAATISGINWACQHNKFKHSNDFTHIVTVDADGQHAPDDVLLVAQKSLDGADYVVGTRNFSADMVPVVKRVANFCADFLTFLLTGKWVNDTYSGLRCLKLESISRLNLKQPDYSFCTEIVVSTLNAGLKISSVPIKAIYTDYSMTKPTRLRVFDSLKLVRKVLS